MAGYFGWEDGLPPNAQLDNDSIKTGKDARTKAIEVVKQSVMSSIKHNAQRGKFKVVYNINDLPTNTFDHILAYFQEQGFKARIEKNTKWLGLIEIDTVLIVWW